MSDVRKSYRYPYLAANILANGPGSIRNSFFSSSVLVTHLLSFLDGNVVLSTACSQPNSETSSSNSATNGHAVSSPQKIFARENPIIIGNVVQILVSYLETSPEPLLEAIRNRPTFIPSIVNLLDVGSVPKLLTSLILDRCVEDVCAMDLGNISFDRPMSYGLTVLSDANIFHLLSSAFAYATQNIFSLFERDSENNHAQELFKAEEVSYNILEVYSVLVKKTIRAVRVQPMSACCSRLHVFANPSVAGTISHILRAGIELFLNTGGEQVSTLNVALGLVIDVLKIVEEDRERRVASVSGQPAPLNTSALEEELEPVLMSLMDVLIDIANSGPRHGQIRLRILELFVECQRVCSEQIVHTLDHVRFGKVAVKLMLLHRKNSLMQHVLCRAVEAALISSKSEVFARHWLLKTKLVQKIMRTWHSEKGSEKWGRPAQAQEAPFLSALVQMACCVEHWMAMRREGASNGTRGMNGDGVREFLPEDVIGEFEMFCLSSLHPILEAEKAVLGGPPPRRRATGGPGNTLGRSFGSFGTTSGAKLRRNSSSGGYGQNRAHLVRSASAHRFGYVEPRPTGRSRLDNMFMEDDLNDGDMGGFGTRSGATSFASIFDPLGDTGL